MDRATTYLCSFPKCGRTWLRFLVANYLDEALSLGVGIDFRTLFTVVPNAGADPVTGEPAFAFEGDDRVPRLVASHDSWSATLGDDPVVLLVRDPLDVLVSYYFHETRQWHLYDGDLKSYIRDPELGVARLAGFLNSWAERLEGHRHVVLTYEGMHANTAGELRRVLEFLGIAGIDDEVLERAVERSSFESMQRTEVAAPLAGHDYEVSDPEARRVRRGAIGGYVDYLDDEDVVYVRTTLEATLTEPAKALLSLVPAGF
jgi:hypothetical protein